MKNIIDSWDEERGVARCIIKYKTSSGLMIDGIGIAECHPDDSQFMSALTGGIIAEYRAQIDLFKKINAYEIKPGIMALKHVYCTMVNSKHYNPKSYEATRLKKELAHLMDEYDENKIVIQNIKNDLANYIRKKDEFYKRIREGKNK